MTVGTTNLTNTFTGDGNSFGPFAFTFAAQQASDIQVYLGGILQSSGMYSVSINTNADGTTGVGGSITFLFSAPANLASGLIVRSCDLLQQTVLPVEGNLSESKIVNAFDRLTMLCQQITSKLAASLQFPIQFQSTVSGILGAPTALYVARMNATNTGVEFVSPAAALAQAAPIPGGGTVVGPAALSVAAYEPALFADTTGQLIRGGPGVGVAGQIFQSQGPGASPIWGSGAASNLKSSGIVGPGRQFPTSGAVSGTYWHQGNWASTGAITAAPGTKVYINGTVTLAHAITVSNSYAGGTASQYSGSAGIYVLPGDGSGIGAGRALRVVAAAAGAGGGGAGFGGAGGSGGGPQAGFIPAGGTAYSYLDSLNGSSGAGGFNNTLSAVGTIGGSAAAGFYLECTGALTVNTGSITSNGGAGAGAGTSGGGGGSGGFIGLRCGNTLTLPIGCISVVGGAGGSGGGNGGGGGGGGGIVDIAAVTLSVNASFYIITGGAAGASSSVIAPTAGSAGIVNQLATLYPVSIF